jgi:hypothetical protein
MQKSLHKCQIALDDLGDFQTNQTSFCWKEQSLNYKFCTRHIFPKRIVEGEKSKTKHPQVKQAQS